MLPRNPQAIKKSVAKFHSSLKIAGYRSYNEYLRSPEWKAFKQWYGASSLPQCCIVCGNPRYILHHWNYTRCGAEKVSDVIPLCDTHHSDIHEWLDANKQPVCFVIAALRMCFGIEKSEAHRIFKQFKDYTGKELIAISDQDPAFTQRSAAPR